MDKLRSGNPVEDAELRRRMDTSHHPTISGDVEQLEDLGGGRWTVTGSVTCRGVTRVYREIVAVDTGDDGALHITGSAAFDVRHFGITPPRVLMLRVHPEVRVTIDVVASA